MIDTQTYHLEIDEGSDYTKRFYYTNKSTGLPLDLTGYSAIMQVRSEYEGDSLPKLVFTSNVGEGITIGGIQGTIDITIPPINTSNKNWSRGSYDLFILDPVKKTKFLKGFFTIIPSSTR